LQGFAPKLAKGEIASLSGAGDDARYFQISVPVQPGNSGGGSEFRLQAALRSGPPKGGTPNVVSAKLSARAALATSGSLPENVNYAVKSSYLLGFLESVPEVSAKLKEPETKERKFEEVVKSAEQAAVLVLVYLTNPSPFPPPGAGELFAALTHCECGAPFVRSSHQTTRARRWIN
jgi:hypothetical protein